MLTWWFVRYSSLLLNSLKPCPDWRHKHKQGKKEKFSSDSYQDKAEFFLSICFCSNIAYAPRLVSLARSRIKRRSFLITTEDHVRQDRGLCPLLFVRDLRVNECV